MDEEKTDCGGRGAGGGCVCVCVGGGGVDASVPLCLVRLFGRRKGQLVQRKQVCNGVLIVNGWRISSPSGSFRNQANTRCNVSHLFWPYLQREVFLDI